VAATTILLARHGETDWNRERRWQGHEDIPLNGTGEAQAHALADALAAQPLTAVYSSDLARAVRTAEIVAGRHGLEVRRVRDLREVDVGEFQGRTMAEIVERWPDAVERFEQTGYGWAGGESFEEMAERVLAAVHRIAGEHPQEHVAVVGHGGTIRVVLAHVHGLGLSEHRKVIPAAANCEVHRLEVVDARLRRAGPPTDEGDDDPRPAVH
jgi:2,3-bisphosphoglycerate-dependent phosphoglycerate mutase